MRKPSMLLCALLAFVLLVTPAVSARNVVSMSLNQDIGTIDPAKTTDWTETLVIINMYDSLVTPLPDGTMGPLIAREWGFDEDTLTYTFHLNEGILFHDGTVLTADDVVFSVERVLALQQGYSWLWADILESIVAVDDLTVQITLSEPYSPFIATLPWLAIVNKDLVLANAQDDDYGQDWLLDNSAGSGPYTFSSWERGNQLVMERFPGYFLGWPDEGAIDEVRARVIFSDSTVLSEMRTQALTIADHYRAIETYTRLDELPGVSVDMAQSGEILYLKMNTQKPPMDNVHVRRAISWAFDYETFLEFIDPGGIQALGPVPQIIDGHNPDLLQYTYDPDKAREELALSGFAPGELTINYCYVEGFELGRRLGLMLQADLAEIGINVQLQPETWARITDLATTVETTPHITSVFSAANFPDPDNYLYTAYHSDAHGTWMSMEWYDDPEVDALIDRARRTIDRDERNAIWYEVQERIVDAAPSVFVYSLPKRYAMQEYVKGFTFVPVMSFEYNFHRMYIER